MSETTITPERAITTEEEVGWIGTNVPRKEDQRLVQGEGVFVDDVRRHGKAYVHFVRSPHAHARIVSIDVSKAMELPGVYGTLTGEEVAKETDPFFQIAPPPGGHVKDFALAVERVRHVGEPVVAVAASTRELAREGADLVEIEYEPLEPVLDLERAADEGVPQLHDDVPNNVVWQGDFDWGDIDGALSAADKVIKIKRLHFARFSSTPLETSGAVVEYNRGTGQWTIHSNNQFPGFAIIMMAPALRVGIDKLRFVSQDIGGGFGNKICTHVQLVALCLLSRKLKRSVQWTEWRTDQHMANSHGNERVFLDVEIPVLNDGTMLGFKARMIDDCGAYTRYEPLGCIIWAQVTPGAYRWRNVRVDFTQVCTNKSPVGPNRGYSRLQHLWLTERIVDIVAQELGFDPVELRKRNYVKAEEMPYETPNGCVYDSGDYARALDEALKLAGYDRMEERRKDAEARGKLLGVGIGSTLDSGTNNFGQSTLVNPELQFSGNNEVATVKLDIFGEIVVTLGTTPQGQSHETTAGQVVADILGVTPDDVHVRAGHDSYWNSHAGFSGTYASQFAVTGPEAGKGATPPPSDPIKRPAAAVPGSGHGAEVRKPDAHLRDADPRVRRRGGPRHRRLRDRRLRGRGRLRYAYPPADRRGPGARRHGSGPRRRRLRDLSLRRGRHAPDEQLLRLPRPACARHAAPEDGLHRVALTVQLARHEGHGRGRRRRGWGGRGRGRGGARRRSGAPRGGVGDGLNAPAEMAGLMPGVESFDVL